MKGAEHSAGSWQPSYEVLRTGCDAFCASSTHTNRSVTLDSPDRLSNDAQRFYNLLFRGSVTHLHASTA